MWSREVDEAHVLAAATAARTYGGVVSRLSAAVSWRWGIRFLPDRPQITVPRGRRLADIDTTAVEVRRMDLPDCDVDPCSPVTTRARTLVDCGRYLPFIDALPVFNSALRAGFPLPVIEELAAGARGPGAVALRRVSRIADPRPQSEFESTLWAICLSVPGLRVEPQVPIGGGAFLGCPDLVDVLLGLAIEADSFEWHGKRAALVRDARRYNDFVTEGWLVLRFTWEDVMLRPDHVQRVLHLAVRDRLSNRALGDQSGN